MSVVYDLYGGGYANLLVYQTLSKKKKTDSVEESCQWCTIHMGAATLTK